MRRLALAAGCVTVLGAGSYVGLVSGRLSLDLGVGRRIRPLGPLTVDISAPRDVVYAVATAPYGERRPRALREKVDIIERGGGMVLAAHRTPVGGGLTAVTVETVSFDPPTRIRLRLTYTGELGTDLGALGERWGDLVERTWVAAVRESLDTIRAEAERRAAV